MKYNWVNFLYWSNKLLYFEGNSEKLLLLSGALTSQGVDTGLISVNENSLT